MINVKQMLAAFDLKLPEDENILWGERSGLLPSPGEAIHPGFTVAVDAFYENAAVFVSEHPIQVFHVVHRHFVEVGDDKSIAEAG